MARPIEILEILPAERDELERRVRADTTSRRDCLRARIVLLRAEGIATRAVAQHPGVSAVTVSKWSQRFDEEGIAGLQDASGRGRKPSIPLKTIATVIEQAGQAPPGRGRWSGPSPGFRWGSAPCETARTTTIARAPSACSRP